MKKDKKWLKEEARNIEHKIEDELYKDDTDFRMTVRLEGMIDVIQEIKELINQLDEPEVLSQDWIDAHKKHGRVSSGIFGDSGLFRDYVLVKDLEKEALLVPKRELPVIPKFVADYIQEGKDLGCDLGTAMTVQTELLKGIRDYIKNNEETFARAWLDGFTVEKEQKYRVIDSHKVYLLAKEEDRNEVETVAKFVEIYGYDHAELDYNLTEQEIKDYDERYWPFAVKVEELEE